MSTTLAIESISDINVKERSQLSAAFAAGVSSLNLTSTTGFAVSDFAYIGLLGRDGCEKVTINAISDADTVGLSSGTTLAHSAYEPVTSVLGDKIRIYRAPNVDGTIPDDGDFAVIATRDIDADQQSTYYTDSTGSSEYWYKYTYYNAGTSDETDLGDSVAVRGDDYGHYASLSEIRTEAGFDNAHNLSDTVIDQQRRAAEAEVNTALSGVYTVPFDPVVPALVNTIVVKLAAGYLLMNAYGNTSTIGKDKITEARALIHALQDGTTDLPETEAASLTGAGVSSWPNDSTDDTAHRDGGGERMFRVTDVF